MPLVNVVRATVSLLRTEDGGRKSPLWSGYRATVFLRADKPLTGNDAVMTLDERDICIPGEDCAVQLRFLSPELVQDVLRPGATFQLKEGSRVIANGKVGSLVKSA